MGDVDNNDQACTGGSVFTSSDGSVYTVGRDLGLDPDLSPNQSKYAVKNLLPLPNANSNDEFHTIQRAFYDTLAVVAPAEAPQGVGNNAQYVATSFCYLTAEEFDVFRGASPLLENCKPGHPVSLFKICSLLVSQPPSPLTRAQVTAHFNATFTKPNVNNVLLGLHNTGKPLTNDNVMTALKNFCQLLMDSIKFINAKIRSGIEAVGLMDELQNQIVKLESLRTDMIGSRIGKDGPMAQSMFCLDLKNLFSEKITEYCTKHSQQFHEAAFLYIRERQVSITIDYANFQAGTKNNNLSVTDMWKIYMHVPNFQAVQLPIVAQKTEALTPIIKEINTFTPSTHSQNLAKCRNLRPLCTNIVSEVSAIRQEEEPSLPLMKSLLKDFDALRKALMDLQISGIVLDESIIGHDPDSLTRLYKSFQVEVDELDQKTQLLLAARKSAQGEIAKNSYNHSKLHLSPLKTSKDWLNFKASCDKILPHMGGDECTLLKAATIQSALHNHDDIAYCRTVDTHSEMLTYLTSKYETPDLIPNLVAECLKMKPPRNYNESYKNLSQFNVLYQHLKNAKAEHKLDKTIRNQLLSLCLMDVDRRQYIADEIIEDERLAKELKNEGLVNSDDSASVIGEKSSHLLEDKKREFFVTKLLSYLKVARGMISSQPNQPNSNQLSPNKFGKQKRNFVPHYHQNQTTSNCPLCKVTHYDKDNRPLVSLGRCIKFKSMSVQERQSTIKKHNYCLRCLRCKNSFPHPNNTCQISDERGISCPNHQTPSQSHHVLLCNSKENAGKAKEVNSGITKNKKNQKNKAKPKNQNKSFMTNTNTTSTDTSSANTVPGMANFWNYQPQFMPRLTGINTSSYTSKISSTDKDKALFTSASTCTILSPSGYFFNELCLLDSGSGLGFVSQKLVKKHKLTFSCYWHGSVATLHGVNQDTFQVYELNIIDHLNKKHTVKLLMVPHIGSKNLIHATLFHKICSDYGLNPINIQNTCGEYGLLLGIDSVHLLGSKVPHFRSKHFPNTALFHSMLSKQYYILGSIGPNLGAADLNQTMVYAAHISKQRDPQLSKEGENADIHISSQNVPTFQNSAKKL